MSETEPVWVEAENGYHLALVDGKLKAKNAKGKQLKSVPSKLKKGDAAEKLLALRDWLVEHQRECTETIERFMLRSLPVPSKLLVAVWDDPAWQQPLRDAVVSAVDKAGDLDPDAAGFLRSVDAKKGIGVVNLDGETVWLDAKQVSLPHPILLEERDDYRELATELGIEQGIPQLFRETFEKPTTIGEGETRVGDFADAQFQQLNHVLGKCRTLGYRVRGGFACCTVWEGREVAEARFWIGAEDPESETWTGDLTWVDDKEHPIALAEVGPVAYSEGTRMASAIYAARYIEKQEDDS